MFARIAEAYRLTRKPKDLIWNKYVARPMAAVLLVPLASSSITPNQVTLASLVVFVAASGSIAFAPGRTGLLIGVGILELAYVLDCVDGQLARLRGTSTPIGAHLDFLMDELKAFLLVASVGVRLWLVDRGPRFLLESLAALVAVASAISLTTFLRRPEYSAAPGAPVNPGTGDYGGGFAVKSAPAAWSATRVVETLGSLVVHYPSYIVFVALANRIDIFLHAYLIVNAAHVGRSLLAITWKLGRRTTS